MKTGGRDKQVSQVWAFPPPAAEWGPPGRNLENSTKSHPRPDPPQTLSPVFFRAGADASLPASTSSVPAACPSPRRQSHGGHEPGTVRPSQFGRAEGSFVASVSNGNAGGGGLTRRVRKDGETQDHRGRQGLRPGSERTQTPEGEAARKPGGRRGLRWPGESQRTGQQRHGQDNR